MHQPTSALRPKATEIADIVGRETTLTIGTFANESLDLSSLRSQGSVKRFGLARAAPIRSYERFVTVTTVLTELATKQFSWAAWCILSSSSALGFLWPPH